jgi:hypothetical protein
MYISDFVCGLIVGVMATVLVIVVAALQLDKKRKK